MLFWQQPMHLTQINLGLWKLPTYPSPNVNICVSLGAKCWVTGGVGGQFPRNLNWSLNPSCPKNAQNSASYRGLFALSEWPVEAWNFSKFPDKLVDVTSEIAEDDWDRGSPKLIFSLQYPYILNRKGHENKQNDHLRENALFFYKFSHPIF